jgi:antibiotic biosynthesis monooxygenase (ABM) superfamily enzyme
MTMASGLIVPLFGMGAAMLAFWLVARFPGAGPQSVKSALVVAAVLFVAQTPLLNLVDPVLGAYGVAAALLFVILPSLTLLFWGAGCLVRSLVMLAAPYRG